LLGGITLRRIIVNALLLSMLILGSPSAHGNFGSLSGGWQAEPAGLEKVRIVHEQLTVDLRGCDGSELEFSRNYFGHNLQPVGKVEALYRLHNSGPEQVVDLVFAAGSLIEKEALRVTIDEEPITVQSIVLEKSQRLQLIDRWKINLHNYWLPISQETSFSVRVKIPTGNSTLRARFRTLIGNDRSVRPTCSWSFIYLLAPARDWGGFDKLDMKVLIPPGWKATSNLDLEREGDSLLGTFDRIPDDALTLSLQMPPEPVLERIREVSRNTWAALCASAIVIVIATWWTGRRTVGGRGRLGILLAGALAWGIVGLSGAWFLLVIPDQLSWIPALQRGRSGSTFTIYDIMWFVAIVVAASGTLLTCVLLLWRRSSSI
jgi:hypothetical protein